MKSLERMDRVSVRSRIENALAGIFSLHIRGVKDIQPAHFVSAALFILIPALIVISNWAWLLFETRIWLAAVIAALVSAYFLSQRRRTKLAAVIASTAIGSIPFSGVYFSPERDLFSLLIGMIWTPIALITIFLFARTWLIILISGVINLALLSLSIIYTSVHRETLTLVLAYFVMFEALLIIGAIRRDFVISAIGRHESAVQEEKLRYQQLFEATFESIIVHKHGIILDINRATEEIFGYKREEVIGRSLLEFVTPNYHSTVLNESTDPNAPPYEAQALRKDGSVIWIEARGKPYLYHGECARVAAIHDIDHLKRAEAQQLELAIERERVGVLQRFLGNMSHDLRTPLSVIKTAAYLIDKLGDQPEKLQRQIDVLHTQTDQLQRMLDDLLQMSRLDKADTSSYQFAWQLVNPLLKEVFDETHNTALRKNIDLDFDVHDRLPKILLDRSEFKRMVKHLVNNAIAYTPESGQVQVSAFARRPPDSERDWVVIEVRDTGVGISSLELPHVFERFYRVDPARAGGSGTGLGLTIARKIAEAHNGMIEAESELGKGSVFRISLPVLAEHHPETEQAEKRQTNARESHG